LVLEACHAKLQKIGVHDEKLQQSKRNNRQLILGSHLIHLWAMGEDLEHQASAAFSYGLWHK